jgi:hypothetical protein
MAEEKKKGIGKKLLNVFVSIPDKEESATVAAKPSGKAKTSVEYAPAKIVVSTEGNINEMILKNLMEAFENANIEGNDYYELKVMLNKMQNAPNMTPQMLYPAAFFAVGGMSKADLLKTIPHYTKALKDQEKLFLKEVEQQSQQTIGKVESEIAGIDQALKEKETELSNLQKEIEQTKASRDEKEASLQDLKKTKESSINDFNTTLQMILDQIAEDETNISTLLPG